MIKIPKMSKKTKKILSEFSLTILIGRKNDQKVIASDRVEWGLSIDRAQNSMHF